MSIDKCLVPYFPEEESNEIKKAIEVLEKVWKDMPIEAIEYVKSLPEFNAVMFKRITGIDTDVIEEMTLEEIEKALGKKIKIKK